MLYIYIPARDIQTMADRGTLKGLEVTMKQHPTSLKVQGSLVDALKQCPSGEEFVVFQGSVRDMCPLAPNYVNTMACAALAAHNLGLDGTRAKLVADDRLETHVIIVDVTGPATGELDFKVVADRINPAPPGAVTGIQTYESFWSSLIGARGQPPGVHFC
jgi:predicted dinucleotide-utilizing enzyme